MLRHLTLVGICLACLSPAQVTEYDNLVYTEASGYPQTLDLFVPEGSTEPRPAIVFVHGGGWAAGDKADYNGWGHYYGALGYVCVSINYRLAPQHIWPAQIDDTQAAVRWVRKWAPVLNVDPARIGAIGSSAGGHLVLFLGETDTLHDFDPTLSGFSSKVQVVADYCGPTDLLNKSEWDRSIWRLIQMMTGRSTSLYNPNLRLASPLYWVKPTDAPTIIFHGDLDTIVPVEQSRRIVARKQSVGAPVVYYEFAGEGHGFSNDPFWISLNAITAFFDLYL